MKHDNQAYDAIIIGAGISGLVCGCYLAKAGMKVLIVEQHNKPGGYCSSFIRQGFHFPAAAHFIGGLKYGNLGRIFQNLGIDKKLKIKKYDPSNIIITPHYRISLWTELDKTIEEFQKIFPHERKAITDFFCLLTSTDPKVTVSMRSLTFQDLLDRYFSSAELKTILGFPLFGNSALPPQLISAFIGTKIFKEYVLDGGYYIEGGIQMLPETLVVKFKELGGEIRLSCPAQKIRIEERKIIGIVTDSRDFIPSKYVVSNCDARQTFFKLLGKNNINQDFIARINAMTPSLSGYILYLGLNEHLKESPEPGVNIWILTDEVIDLQDMYLAIKRGDFRTIKGYLLYVSPDKKKVMAFLAAPFKNKRYWGHQKLKLSETLINRIEKDVIHKISSYIKIKDAATPQTLHRYTLNYKGAAFGWACFPSQLALPDFRKPSFVHGLYMTGHWTTKGFGIPGVIYVGEDTAKMILKKERGNHSEQNK